MFFLFYRSFAFHANYYGLTEPIRTPFSKISLFLFLFDTLLETESQGMGAMNQIRTWLFLLGLPLAMILVGDLVAHEAGVFAALFITILMYVTAFNSNDVILRLYHAQEAGADDAPQLKAIVSSLAQKAGLPIPKIYLIKDDSPNAFSIGHHKAKSGIVVTTGLLDTLNQDELAAVIAHELSHINHQDTLIATISTVVAGFFSGLANTAVWKKLFDEKNKVEDKINPTLMRIFGPIAAGLIKISVSGSKEFLADQDGAKLCGNPQALASALEKIEMSKTNKVFAKAEILPATAHLFFVNPLQQPQLVSLFHTQPLTAERIRQLSAAK